MEGTLFNKVMVLLKMWKAGEGTGQKCNTINKSKYIMLCIIMLK